MKGQEKMKKLKYGALVILLIVLFYMLFTYIDKEDKEALANCKKENSTQYCMRSIYG